MLRPLATFVLIVPLFFNGLWMVCTERPGPAIPADSGAQSEVVPVCDGVMCPLEKPTTGALCLFTSTGDGSAMAAIFFAVATPPETAVVEMAAMQFRASVPQTPAAYLNPDLAGATPPPKA